MVKKDSKFREIDFGGPVVLSPENVEPVGYMRFRSCRLAADDVIEGFEPCKTIEQVSKGAFVDPYQQIRELESRIAELEARCAAHEMAVDTMDQATRRAYISGAATVHHIRQIVAEAQAGAGREGERGAPVEVPDLGLVPMEGTAGDRNAALPDVDKDRSPGIPFTCKGSTPE